MYVAQTGQLIAQHCTFWMPGSQGGDFAVTKLSGVNNYKELWESVISTAERLFQAAIQLFHVVTIVWIVESPVSIAGLPEDERCRTHAVRSPSKPHRHSGIQRSASQVGIPIAPAKCTTALSELIRRSQFASTAAVSMKSIDWLTDSCPATKF